MSIKSLIVTISLLAWLTVTATAILMSGRKVKWIAVPSTHILAASQTPDAMEENDYYTYICRAKTDTSDIYSGKITVAVGEPPKCCYGLNGNEIKTDTFEILMAPSGSVSWLLYEGKIPENAVVSGKIGGVNTFACRGWTDDKRAALVTGYVAGADICYVSFWKEIPLTQYEVLVKNEFGILMNY